jgi:hypothetical protein
MHPDKWEQESKKVAKLLIYIFESMNQSYSPKIKKAAEHVYGDSKRVHKFTAKLCKKLESLDDDQLNRIVYDGRIAKARQLAQWWDDHKEADKRKDQK